MLDIVPIAGMVFSLLFALIVGGFILLYPLTRRLGQLIELRLEERRAGGDDVAITAALDQLRVAVEGIQRDVHALQERQEFTDRLLESGERGERGGPAARPGDSPGGRPATS